MEKFNFKKTHSRNALNIVRFEMVLFLLKLQERKEKMTVDLLSWHS